MKKEDIRSILIKYRNYTLTDMVINSIADEFLDLVLEDITRHVIDKK